MQLSLNDVEKDLGMERTRSIRLVLDYSTWETAQRFISPALQIVLSNAAQP